MHSHYSDGQASPKDLLRAAKEHNLTAIAITDHDTTKGSKEARDLAAAYGVELVSGIELTCYWEGYSGHSGGPDIDLLGYFIDLDSPLLAEVEKRLHETARIRADRCCQLLQRLGYTISLEDVLETNPYYPAFIAFSLTFERLQLAPSEETPTIIEQAYYRAGRSRLSIQNAIKLVHQLGGVAVLAHPTVISREMDAEPLSERGVMELAEAGLDGLEVYHHRLRSHHRQHFKVLAKMAQLAISGGSDEHQNPARFKRFASQPVSRDMLETLRSRRPKYP